VCIYHNRRAAAKEKDLFGTCTRHALNLRGETPSRPALLAIHPLADRSEGSIVEDHIHPNGQRVWYGPVAAGVDEILQVRLHEQAGSDGASVHDPRGYSPVWPADGRSRQGLNPPRAPQVAAVRAVGQAEAGKIARTTPQESVGHEAGVEEVRHLVDAL